MAEIRCEFFTACRYLFYAWFTSFMKGESHHSQDFDFQEERVVFVDEIQSFRVALKSAFSFAVTRGGV
jgi:hypothetical protein